jgi:LPS-assembly protein
MEFQKNKIIYLSFQVIFIIAGLNVLPLFADEGKSRGLLSVDDDSPIEITAKSQEYNKKESLYIADGDVLITKGGISLTSQKATYHAESGIAEASGDITFNMGEDILSGESGVFNLTDMTGKINRGRLFLSENHYYISGDTMEKVGEDSYMIKDFRLTTCDGPDPTWSITGSEVEVTLEGYGKVRNAAFRVKDIPVIYLPYMIFAAKTTRQSGLLQPQIGYSDRNGMELEVPVFWAISDQADATFYERYMSRRGLMQGLEYRYVAEKDSGGTFLFDILSDRIGEKDLNNPEHAELGPFERTNRGRYWLRGRADQEFPSNIRARLDMDIVSDQDYFREFRYDLTGYQARPDLSETSGRPVDDIYSPTRRSALRLSRDNPDYSLQAVASYYQRPEGFVNDTTSQPLAGIDFAYLPRPLWKGSSPSFSMEADYNYIWRDFGQKGHSISITPRLKYPTWLGDFLEFEPSVSFTKGMQWLDNNSENIDSQSRDAYRFQARFSSILERIFDIEWNQATKLKHKIMPSIVYEYRVHRDEDRYKPWFEPVDAYGKINRLTLSIDNFIDVKKVDEKGNITYSQWGTLSLIQGYDMDEARRDIVPWRKREAFEPLSAILTFMPSPNLDLDAEARWDHYKNDISFADLSLEFNFERSSGKKDIYEIDYVYLDEGNKGLSYYLDVNLVHGFSAGSSLQRDLDRHHDIEKSYWLGYRSQCWGVRLIVEKFDEDSRVMLTFNLLGLGE